MRRATGLCKRLSLQTDQGSGRKNAQKTQKESENKSVFIDLLLLLCFLCFFAAIKSGGKESGCRHFIPLSGQTIST
jgi:hypothetical protein